MALYLSGGSMIEIPAHLESAADVAAYLRSMGIPADTAPCGCDDTPTAERFLEYCAEFEYLRRAIAERFRGHVLAGETIEAMNGGPPVVTPQMLRDFLLDAGATPDIVVERDPNDPHRVIVSKPMPVTIIAGKL